MLFAQDGHINQKKITESKSKFLHEWPIDVHQRYQGDSMKIIFSVNGVGLTACSHANIRT